MGQWVGESPGDFPTLLSGLLAKSSPVAIYSQLSPSSECLKVAENSGCYSFACFLLLLLLFVVLFVSGFSCVV